MSDRGRIAGRSTAPRADSRISLVAHWLDTGQPARALRELGDMPGEIALTPPATRLRGLALIRLHRASEAVSTLRAGMERNSVDAASCHLLAVAHLQLRHLVAAEQAILDALAISPRRVDYLVAYATICLCARQIDKAEQLLDVARAIQPDNVDALRACIRIAWARGDMKTATGLLERTLEIDPTSVATNSTVALIAASRRRIGEAERAGRRGAELNAANDASMRVVENLRVVTHPALTPLRPYWRYPYWYLAVANLLILGSFAFDNLTLTSGLVGLWGMHVLYAWLGPTLVRRSLRRSARRAARSLPDDR